MTLDNIELHNLVKLYIAIKDEVVVAILEHPIKELPFDMRKSMFNKNTDPEERKRLEDISVILSHEDKYKPQVDEFRREYMSQGCEIDEGSAESLGQFLRIWHEDYCMLHKDYKKIILE